MAYGAGGPFGGFNRIFDFDDVKNELPSRARYAEPLHKGEVPRVSRVSSSGVICHLIRKISAASRHARDRFVSTRE
jgi:hypothetical protein